MLVQLLHFSTEVHLEHLPLMHLYMLVPIPTVSLLVGDHGPMDRHFYRSYGRAQSHCHFATQEEQVTGT